MTPSDRQDQQSALREAKRFIAANTKLLSPPLVPEIRLHLAEETLPIWQKSEEELGELGVPAPFWAFAWAGGQALARYVLDHPQVVTDRSVLDLGSGSGLVAIAAIHAGARSAVANDTDPLAMAAAELNAVANDQLITASQNDLLSSDPSGFDAVLIGDLFYERELSDRVLAFAEAALRTGATVLVGDPNRTYCPSDRLTQLETYSVPVVRELEDMEIRSTTVWRLTSVSSGR